MLSEHLKELLKSDLSTPSWMVLCALIVLELEYFEAYGRDRPAGFRRRELQGLVAITDNPTRYAIPGLVEKNVVSVNTDHFYKTYKVNWPYNVDPMLETTMLKPFLKYSVKKNLHRSVFKTFISLLFCWEEGLQNTSWTGCERRFNICRHSFKRGVELLQSLNLVLPNWQVNKSRDGWRYEPRKEGYKVKNQTLKRLLEEAM